MPKAVLLLSFFPCSQKSCSRTSFVFQWINQNPRYQDKSWHCLSWYLAIWLDVYFIFILLVLGSIWQHCRAWPNKTQKHNKNVSSLPEILRLLKFFAHQITLYFSRHSPILRLFRNAKFILSRVNKKIQKSILSPLFLNVFE